MTFFLLDFSYLAMKLLLLVVVMTVLSVDAAKDKAIKVKDKDMMRKMIIYDKVKWQLHFNRAFKFIKKTCKFNFLEKSEHVLLSSPE